MKRQIKKVFLTAVAVVALGSLTSNAKVSVIEDDICLDRAFDAAEFYYDNPGSDGFDAGLAFEIVYSLCVAGLY